MPTRQTWAAVIVVLLVLMLALTLASCAADPPRVALEDVVDLGVGPACTADRLYHPPEPPDSVIEAYRRFPRLLLL